MSEPSPILPGAMVYLISDEIIEETHREGLHRFGILGLMIGLAVIIFLGVTLA